MRRFMLMLGIFGCLAIGSATAVQAQGYCGPGRGYGYGYTKYHPRSNYYYSQRPVYRVPPYQYAPYRGWHGHYHNVPRYNPYYSRYGYRGGSRGGIYIGF